MKAFETNEGSNEVRLCSVVSREAGDDPAGTATPFERCLMVEVPPPYQRLPDESRRFPVGLAEILDAATDAGLIQKFGAFMPERAYSERGYARVFLFRRPNSDSFSDYEKDDFLVPLDDLNPLVEALLRDEDLSKFERYRRESASVREVFVCTHNNRDVCCGKFGDPVYKELRRNVAAGSLRVWRASHIGGHRFAATLVDFPSGMWWGHLDRESCTALVRRESPFSDFSRNYRGCSGLDGKFEQIAEREILRREGWRWMDFERRADIFSSDEERVEVRVSFTDPETDESGAYHATLETNGGVMTLVNSGVDPLEEVRQYRVARLERL